MNEHPDPQCAAHQIGKQWQLTTFEYRDNGIRVEVPDVPAWVCPIDGEASFTPEVVDQLIDTVRELVATAKRAHERRAVFTEYLVTVG